MRAAMIGDNCIDLYRFLDGREANRRYPTGNVVDTGVNLRKLGIPTSVISTTGSDEAGAWMLRTLIDEGLDVSHLKVGDGPTAVTYMDMNGTDRVHGEYVEGVLERMVFDERDIAFAAEHDLVHTALWGKAEGTLPEIRKRNPSVLISFDYCDRLEDPVIEKTLPFVDFGFFSFHKGRDEFLERYLKDKADRGLKVAVATFGEMGSLAFDGKEYIPCGICPAPRVVNTVGAGDSYIAGFLWGALHGLPVGECMRKGAEISAQVVQVFEPWVRGGGTGDTAEGGEAR